MFKNIHLKILALVAAMIFWVFVVSLENAFLQFPHEIPIQVFNQSSDLALASVLPGVKLTVRARDAADLRKLAANDFEVYVDLRDVGEGTHRIPVSFSSKNAEITVLRATPADIDINLEPVKQKNFTVSYDVSGQPAKGFKLQSVKLSKDSVVISGAQSALKKVSRVKAMVVMQGTEKRSFTRKVEIGAYSYEDNLIEGLKIEDGGGIEANVTIEEVSGSKEVGVKPKFIGSIANATIKNIEIFPAAVSIVAAQDVLKNISILETEPIELKDAADSFEKNVKIVLPEGVELENKAKPEARVKVEIEKQVMDVVAPQVP